MSNVGSKNEEYRGKGFKSELTYKRRTATATATAVPSLPWPPPLLKAQAAEPALPVSLPQSPCATAIDTSEGRMRTSVKCRARHLPPLRPLTMQLPFLPQTPLPLLHPHPGLRRYHCRNSHYYFHPRPGSRRGRSANIQASPSCSADRYRMIPLRPLPLLFSPPPLSHPRPGHCQRCRRQAG